MVRWSVILAIVIVLLAGIQIYRVNRPKTTVSEIPAPVLQTTGTIVDDAITIPPGGFMPYKMNFTHRVRVVGKFRAVDTKNKFATLLMTEDDFEKWKNGLEHKAVARTPYIPGGKMNHVLEAGTYYLVFDNQEPDKEIQLAATFNVE